jgi:hypothetical protein
MLRATVYPAVKLIVERPRFVFAIANHGTGPEQRFFAKNRAFYTQFTEMRGLAALEWRPIMGSAHA